MTTLITESLVRTGVREFDEHGRTPPEDLVGFLSSVLGQEGSKVFSVSFDKDHPLLAVGAPARVFFPAAASRLGMALDVPYHADVAGAVGSVASKVVQRARLTVTQPSQGVFRVHCRAGPRDFRRLEEALNHARDLAAHEARELAKSAGAPRAEVTVTTDENRVDHDIDGSVFFEATVCATASGPAETGDATSVS